MLTGVQEIQQIQMELLIVFFYRYFAVIFTKEIFPSLTPLVYTNRNTLLVNTEGIPDII